MTSPYADTQATIAPVCSPGAETPSGAATPPGPGSLTAPAPIEPTPEAGSVLVLGGTGEARRLAVALQDVGVPFLSSLAGRVSNPAMPVGMTRIGGFGGAEGLADYLRRHTIAAVVDATHPFAATITANAARATQLADVPLLRLQRPGWLSHPHAGEWTWVDTHEEAARAAARLGERVFLTTGRQTLDRFAAEPTLAARYVLVRLVEPPAEGVPAAWEVLRSRGPFTAESEARLMADRAIDVLVTKDSGGPLTEPKLGAAAERGAAVVVIRRPSTPEGVAEVSDVSEAAAWARKAAARRRNG